MMQIQPETGEYLVFFFKILIQLFLLRSFLSFLIIVSMRVSKIIVLSLNEKVPVYEAATA